MKPRIKLFGKLRRWQYIAKWRYISIYRKSQDAWLYEKKSNDDDVRNMKKVGIYASLRGDVWRAATGISLWLSVKNVCHKSGENPTKSHFCIFFSLATNIFSFVMCHLPFVNSFQLEKTGRTPKSLGILIVYRYWISLQLWSKIGQKLDIFLRT